MNQQDLIEKCVRKDSKAQEELFERYKGLVMSICLRYAKDKEQAEDLLQETFIKVFKHLSKKNKPQIEDLKNWICRVTINTTISQYEKFRKHEHENYPEVLDESHRIILDQLSMVELLDVITSLPDGYRVIFNMYLIDGYSHEEIAQTLKISVSTSRSQLTRAKSLLRKKLETIGIYSYEAS